MLRESKIKSLSYDEVLLVPKYSEVNSRDDVNLFYKNENHFPIFSAPMKAISTPELIISLGKLGGVGILHRFFSNEKDRYEAIEKISENKIPFGVAVGLADIENAPFLNFLESMHCDYICLDVAYGNLRKSLSATKTIERHKKIWNHNYKIISGNVATYNGIKNLYKNGAEYARVGIGGGSVCSTRNVTGCAVPDLSAIRDCYNFNKTPIFKKYSKKISIIADGGIKSSGEAMKAFAFGASHIMIGGLLAKAKEANNNGEYYGMSSKKLQTEMGKYLKSNEGLVKQIPEDEIRPLEEIFTEFLYGVKSGFSYLGCNDINNLKNIDIDYIKAGRGAIKNL